MKVKSQENWINFLIDILLNFYIFNNNRRRTSLPCKVQSGFWKNFRGISQTHRLNYIWQSHRQSDFICIGNSSCYKRLRTLRMYPGALSDPARHLPYLPDIFHIQPIFTILTNFIQVPSVAPVILPDIYRIFCESERFTVRTRARAVEIFTTLTSMICTMGEVGNLVAKYEMKKKPACVSGEQVAAEVFVEPSLVNIFRGVGCLPLCPWFTNIWCWTQNRGTL